MHHWNFQAFYFRLTSAQHLRIGANTTPNHRMCSHSPNYALCFECVYLIFFFLFRRAANTIAVVICHIQHTPVFVDFRLFRLRGGINRISIYSSVLVQSLFRFPHWYWFPAQNRNVSSHSKCDDCFFRLLLSLQYFFLFVCRAEEIKKKNGISSCILNIKDWTWLWTMLL